MEKYYLPLNGDKFYDVINRYDFVKIYHNIYG